MDTKFSQLGESELDDIEMEGNMLEATTKNSIFHHKYMRLRRLFVLSSAVCCVAVLLLIVEAALLASKTNKKCDSRWDDLPEASYCRSYFMNANAGNFGDRMDAHNAWSLTEKCQDYVRGYMDNQYNADLEVATNDAKEKLTAILAESSCSATSQCLLILDIDETSLSNYPHIKAENFVYNEQSWNNWLDQAKAPAIAPTLDLYKNMTSQGVKVAFITGRNCDYQNQTDANLKSVGYDGFLTLITKCVKATAVEYKTNERKKLSASQNLTIIGSIGDQWSDLLGGDVEYTVKLPNPLYYVQ